MVERLRDGEEFAEIVEMWDLGAAHILMGGVDPFVLEGEDVHERWWSCPAQMRRVVMFLC